MTSPQTPAWARQRGLPEHHELQYVRTCAAIVLLGAIALYVAAALLKSPRSARRMLRRRVFG